MSTQKKFLDIQNLKLYHSLILEEIRKNIQEVYDEGYMTPEGVEQAINEAIAAITDGQGAEYIQNLQATVEALEARVADLEDQMTVTNSNPAGANDFSEVEPENSSDYVITGYEPEE